MNRATKKHQKLSRKLVSLFFVGCLLFVQITAPVMSVQAAQANPSDQLERWLYYRGMRACFNNPFFGLDVRSGEKISATDINKGKLNIKSSYNVTTVQKVGFGYLAPGLDSANDNDGTVDCDNDKWFPEGAKMFGFKDPVALICEMNRALPPNENDTIKPSHPTDCEKSESFEFKGGNNHLQGALTKALERGGSKDRPPFNINENNGPDYTYKALLYLIGKRSLEVFCGNNTSISTANSDGNLSNKKIVSVDYVNTDTMKVMKSQHYALPGDRDEDKKVDDIYYKQGGDENKADDLKCWEMAAMTRDGNSQAYLDWAKKHPDLVKKNEEAVDSGSSSGGSGGEETACGIEGGLGWVLCPIIRTMANIGDGLFGFMADNFLSMPATLFDQGSEEGKAMFSAWSRFRDMANIAFVIFFLFIIYSQLVGGSRSGGGAGAEITGGMLSNYGVKKLLPRVIVSAVLINVSFWLCAIAIDLSNIIGYGSKSLFDTISNTPEIQSAVSADNQGLGWTSIALVVIAGAVVWINLAALIGLLGLSIVALIVVVVTLLIRKALIILLIAIAPIAIVAYMLPNTKSWFDKWRKTFMTLLMVFPIIGVVFGASSLASIIVQATAGSDDNMTKILGASIAVLPLIAVPTIIKGSLATIGQLGAKINGVGDKLGSKASSKATDRFDKSALGQFKAYRRGEKEKRQALTRAGKYTGRNPIRRGASKLQGGIYSRMPGKFGDRIIASGTALADKEWDEEVGRQKTSLTGTSSGDLLKIMKDKSISAEKRAAAAGIIMSRGHRESQLRALEIAHEGRGNGDRDMGSIQKQMAEDMKDSPFALGSHAKEALETGNYGAIDPTTSTPTDADPRAELKKRVGTKLSPAGLAKLDPDELKSIHKMARDEELSPSELANLQAQIAALRLDPQYKGTEKPEATKLYDEIIADAYASGAGGVGSAHYNDSNVF